MSKTEKGRAKKALPKKQARAISDIHAAIKDDPRNQTVVGGERYVRVRSTTEGSKGPIYMEEFEKPEGINPKDAMGQKKPSLSLVPPAALVYIALAMKNGADKYSRANWRENNVIATIYIDAALRHLCSWLDGEECAEDSGVPHLGHALATISILVDALEGGVLVDDRPTAGPGAAVIKKFSKV